MVTCIVFSISEMLQEVISPWSCVFFKKKKQHSISQNPAMTTCLISAFFLGISDAQAVAADDLVEQCPSAVSGSVCQPHSGKQQHIEIGTVTLGRGNGKILGKRVMLRLHGTSITDRWATQFYCFPSHSFMKI